MSNILPKCECCSVCLEMSWITIIYKNADCRSVMCPSFIIYIASRFILPWNFHALLCSLKNNEFSVLHYIIKLKKLPYTTLCYIASRFIRPIFGYSVIWDKIKFYVCMYGTFAYSFIMLLHRSLASSWGLLAIKRIYRHCNAMNAKTTDS